MSTENLSMDPKEHMFPIKVAINQSRLETKKNQVLLTKVLQLEAKKIHRNLRNKLSGTLDHQKMFLSP